MQFYIPKMLPIAKYNTDLEFQDNFSIKTVH